MLANTITLPLSAVGEQEFYSSSTAPISAVLLITIICCTIELTDDNA